MARKKIKFLHSDLQIWRQDELFRLEYEKRRLAQYRESLRCDK